MQRQPCGFLLNRAFFLCFCFSQKCEGVHFPQSNFVHGLLSVGRWMFFPSFKESATGNMYGWETHALAYCAALSEPTYCVSRAEDARQQIPSYALFNIALSSEFLGEPSHICAAESLQMPCDLEPPPREQGSKKCAGDIFLNVFSFCPVSHGGVVDRCPISGSSAVPRTWAGRSAGSHTGTLGDQLNSRHSSHSPFEGKANREGFNGPPLTPPRRPRKGNTVLVSGLITR